MRNEPNWLAWEQIEQLNLRIVTDSNEPFGVLSPNALKSAPTRPIELWYREDQDDLAVLAVRLMMAIAWAHPFIQGNKRTGFIAADIFLDANGWLLDIPDFDDIGQEITDAVAEPELEGDLVEIFRRNLIEMA